MKITIEMGNKVHTLELDEAPVTTRVVPDWTMPDVGYALAPSATTDKTYRLTMVHGIVVACTCPGFHYRGYCKHLTGF